MRGQTKLGVPCARQPWPRVNQLNPLRAVLLNQHEARRVIRALPGLLDQMFEPMDRFRQAFIANLYDAEVETQPG